MLQGKSQEEKLEKYQTLFNNKEVPTLIIPKNVEKKIRLLCALSPNLEWSGILFYSVEGTFEDSNLVMTCRDILVLDQGNAGETEIDMNTTDVAAYLAQNIELLDCYQGLIHSHHKMDTFFSGTDQNTLLQEGTNRNNFLSLIVNNNGKYTAGITRKVVKTITNWVDSKEEKSYQFFDKCRVTSPTKETQYDERKTETTIEWCNCNIQKESVGIIDNVVSQFQKIQDRKSKAARRIVTWGGKEPTLFEKEPTLFNNYGNPTFTPDKDQKIWNSNDSIDLNRIVETTEWDEAILKKLCCKILSGTPLAQKATLEELASLYDTIVKRSFRGKSGSFYELDYSSWLSTWLEYIVTEDEDFGNLAYTLEFDDEECTSIVVTKIYQTLDKILPKSNSKELLLSELNKYIDLI